MRAIWFILTSLTAILIGLFVFGITTALFADEWELPRYDYKVIRVIDGDTVVIEAPYLPDPLKKELAIRVYGVDTPEKSWRGKCDKEKNLGAEASRFTTNFIFNAEDVKVEIRKWDKFGGRVLGDLFIDGQSLTQELIARGYAREYYGDKKQSWCD